MPPNRAGSPRHSPSPARKRVARSPSPPRNGKRNRAMSPARRPHQRGSRSRSPIRRKQASTSLSPRPRSPVHSRVHRSPRRAKSPRITRSPPPRSPSPPLKRQKSDNKLRESERSKEIRELERSKERERERDNEKGRNRERERGLDREVTKEARGRDRGNLDRDASKDSRGKDKYGNSSSKLRHSPSTSPKVKKERRGAGSPPSSQKNNEQLSERHRNHSEGRAEVQDHGRTPPGCCNVGEHEHPPIPCLQKRTCGYLMETPPFSGILAFISSALLAASNFMGIVLPLQMPRQNSQNRHGAENPEDDSISRMKAAEEALEAKQKEKLKPSFELSGKLAAETNKVRGITLLFNEPPDAQKPKIRWRLYVFKAGEPLNEPLYIHRQSCYLFGRERRVADIPTDHPSCSKQHAVIQYRKVQDSNEVRPYLMDLGSTNGTFINHTRLEPQRYYELMEKDTVRFGNSSREYVILHENSVG